MNMRERKNVTNISLQYIHFLWHKQRFKLLLFLLLLRSSLRNNLRPLMNAFFFYYLKLTFRFLITYSLFCFNFKITISCSLHFSGL